MYDSMNAVITNDPIGMNNLQQGLLQALVKFDQICRKNNIKYSIHGGTLLGGVREKGFIPWDNDIDVTMMRSEYKKLKAVICNCQSEFYIDDYNYNWTQLWLKGTSEQEAVWIDVIVYDYTYNNLLLRRLKTILLVFLLGIRKTQLTMGISHRKWSKDRKWLVQSVLYYVGKVIPKKTKKQMQDYLAEKLASKSKSFIQRSTDSYQGIIIIFPSDYMSEYTDLIFECQTVMTTKHWHEILVSSYGVDYMIPKRSDENIDAHEMIRQQSESRFQVSPKVVK